MIKFLHVPNSDENITLAKLREIGITTFSVSLSVVNNDFVRVYRLDNLSEEELLFLKLSMKCTIKDTSVVTHENSI
jgi:hypothetical protein